MTPFLPKDFALRMGEDDLLSSSGGGELATPGDIETSRRGDIEAAFDKVAGGSDAADVSAAEAEKVVEQSAAERARDESGRFAAKKSGQQAVPVKEGPNPAARTPAAQAKTLPQGSPPAPSTQVAKPPPQAWRPAVREKWAELPQEVRDEVLRVDAHVRQTMRDAAQARERWGAFEKVAAPFEAMLRAEGSDAISAADELFRTAAALRIGAPQVKAKLVADVIRTYGVDPTLLAAALQGAPMPAGQPGGQYSPAAFRDPRVDQLLSRFEQSQQARQAEDFRAGEAEWAAFSKDKPYAADLAPDMAKLMEGGIASDYPEAYELALAMPKNREFRDVLSQRDAARAAEKAKASTQRSKRAATSVRNEPAGVAPAKERKFRSPDEERRADIEAALEAVGGR